MDVAKIITFLESQADKISEDVGKQSFPDIIHTSLVSIDDSGWEWESGAKTYTDSEFSYYLTLDGAARAMQLDIEIPRDDARSARRAAMQRLDHIVFHGDASHEWQGLINSSDARRLDSVALEFEGEEQEDKIISEIKELLFHSDGNRLADTLLLPLTLLTDHLHLREKLSQANAYTATTKQPLTIRGLHMLNEAGNDGTRRAVAYAKDSVKLHLPMSPGFLPPFQCAADTFIVQGIFRTGGLKISEPEEIRYLDGI